MRTDPVSYFLDIAERCARQSTCLRRGYGAVIVDTRRTIISTGYNGAPCGTKDCLEIGKCWRKENNIPSGSHYEKCLGVHAEMNALIQAGRLARGCDIYIVGVDKVTEKRILGTPCALCTRLMVNAGIANIWTQQVYEDGESCVVVNPPQYHHNLYNLMIFGDEVNHGEKGDR